MKNKIGIGETPPPSIRPQCGREERRRACTCCARVIKGIWHDTHLFFLHIVPSESRGTGRTSAGWVLFIFLGVRVDLCKTDLHNVHRSLCYAPCRLLGYIKDPVSVAQLLSTLKQSIFAFFLFLVCVCTFSK